MDRTGIFRIASSLPALAMALFLMGSAWAQAGLPSNAKVQNNPVFGDVFTDRSDRPYYVFVCDGEIESGTTAGGGGGTTKEICRRVREKTKVALEPGMPVCVEACAVEHPPFLASADEAGGADWSKVKRNDGSLQWTYKGRPLYRYKHDGAQARPAGMPIFPLGNEVGGVWGVALVSGKIIQNLSDTSQRTLRAEVPVAPGVRVEKTETGRVYADHRGLTLYVHATGRTVPHGARKWNRMTAPAIGKPIGDWSIVEAEDKTLQWSYKGHLVFTCDDDVKPGDLTCEEDGWRVLSF